MIFFTSLAALVPAARGATFSLAWDDDAFMMRDHGYTSGLRLAYVADVDSRCRASSGLGCNATRWAARLPGLRSKPNHAGLLALQQVMMTPQDLRRADANFNDLPYVGHASLSAGLFGWDAHQLIGFGLSLGVVGADSGAGWLQRHVHRLVHDPAPAGWSHQLGQDATAGVYATWLQRTPERKLARGRRLLLAYGGSVEAGSWQSSVRGQVFLRLGRNLARNFIPDYRSNGNAASLVGLEMQAGSGWELFFGLEGRYNAYDYVSHHSGPYHVGLRHLTAGAMVGASWHLARGPTITLLLQHASSPLRKGGSRSYGTLALTWRI